MTYYVPESGEKVIINGGLVAVIDSVDVEGNLVRFHTEHPSGGTTAYTEHLSHTRIEPLVPKVEQPELPRVLEPKAFNTGKASDK